MVLHLQAMQAADALLQLRSLGGRSRVPGLAVPSMSAATSSVASRPSGISAKYVDDGEGEHLESERDQRDDQCGAAEQCVGEHHVLRVPPGEKR